MKYTIVVVALFAIILAETTGFATSLSETRTETSLSTKRKNKKKKRSEKANQNVSNDTITQPTIPAIDTLTSEKVVVVEPSIVRHWNDSSLVSTQTNKWSGTLTEDQKSKTSLWEKNYSEVEKTFAQYNIPTDCIYLALTNVFSPEYQLKRGPWQLDYTASVRAGLTINSVIDERLYFERSTEAAAIHLSMLHNIYNNWSHALAAYLLDPRTMDQIKESSNTELNFLEMVESCTDEKQKNRLAAFLKAKQLGESLNTEIEENDSTTTLRITKAVDLRQISTVLSIEQELLKSLNPGIRKQTLALHSLPIHLTLPKGKDKEFALKTDSIHSYQKEVYFPPAKKYTNAQSYISAPPKGSNLVYHTVRSGDVLGRIAEQYHVSVRNLQSWNNIRGTNIRIGQKLKVYTKSGSTQASTPKPTSQPAKTTSVLKEGEYIIHTIKKGESPWLIAKKYPGVSADNILLWNNLTNAKYLRPGMKLKIKK